MKMMSVGGFELGTVDAVGCVMQRWGLASRCGMLATSLPPTLSMPVTPPLLCADPKRLQTWPNVPWGAESPPGESHRSDNGRAQWLLVKTTLAEEGGKPRATLQPYDLGVQNY